MQAFQGDQDSGRRSGEGGRPLRIRIRLRRDRTQGAPITVNLAPMIDVSFLLLIFFLVTTSFERAEGILASNLPRDRGAPAVALPISPIVVRLAQTGPGDDDYSIRIDHFEAVPAGPSELTEHLHRIHQQIGFDQQTPIVIVAQSAVRWDHVVGCWNAALRAGCERIAFAEP